MGNIFSRTIIRDPGGSLPVRTVADIVPTDGSRLIVEPGTVSCFICNGEASPMYPPGSHILNTGVSPFFLKLANWKTGGEAPISACAFYVSTDQEFCCTISSGDVAFREQKFALALKAQCEVSLRYRISSPLRFLRRVVGMNRNTITAADLNLRLQQALLPQLRDQLGRRLAHCDVTDMTSDLHTLSRELTNAIAPELGQYGLQGKLDIQTLQIPEEQLQRVSALEQEQIQTRLRIEAEKQSIKEIYGSLDKRTQVELLTGVSRVPPLPGQAAPPLPTGGSNASMMASLPLQIAMLQQLLGNLSNPGLFNHNNPPAIPSDDPFGWASFPAPKPKRSVPSPLPLPRKVTQGGD